MPSEPSRPTFLWWELLVLFVLSILLLPFGGLPNWIFREKPR